VTKYGRLVGWSLIVLSAKKDYIVPQRNLKFIEAISDRLKNGSMKRLKTTG